MKNDIEKKKEKEGVTLKFDYVDYLPLVAKYC